MASVRGRRRGMPRDGAVPGGVAIRERATDHLCAAYSVAVPSCHTATIGGLAVRLSTDRRSSGSRQSDGVVSACLSYQASSWSWWSWLAPKHVRSESACVIRRRSRSYTQKRTSVPRACRRTSTRASMFAVGIKRTSSQHPRSGTRGPGDRRRTSAADHVRSQRYRVRHSDVDLLGDPDRVNNLDPAPYAPTSAGRRSFHCVARS